MRNLQLFLSLFRKNPKHFFFLSFPSPISLNGKRCLQPLGHARPPSPPKQSNRRRHQPPPKASPATPLRSPTQTAARVNLELPLSFGSRASHHGSSFWAGRAVTSGAITGENQASREGVLRCYRGSVSATLTSLPSFNSEPSLRLPRQDRFETPTRRRLPLCSLFLF